MSVEKPKRTRPTRSKIPGMGSDSTPRAGTKDSLTTTTYEAFYTEGKAIGIDNSYGGTIENDDKLFYSTREPVGVWWVCNVADDIWDNWFQLEDIKNPDSDDLDNKVQKALYQLKARIQLPRETLFERRYGTAILLLSYTGFNTNWEEPLFTPNKDGSWPKLGANQKILQITPYSWTGITVDVDTNESSLRRGLPEYYNINLGTINDFSCPVTSIHRGYEMRSIGPVVRCGSDDFTSGSSTSGFMP